MKVNGRIRNWSLLAMALLIVFGVAACGSSGGVAGGGIGGTGKSVGAITAFGSIFVNGVEFEIDDVLTSISIDDQAGTEGDLKLGMVVRVEGEFNDNGLSGFADIVVFDDSLEGPVSAIDNTLKKITILELEVVYDASTIFYDDINDVSITIAGISTGNVVEVSGLNDSNGVIRATRIEKKALSFPSPGIEIEVKGQVAFLDTTASTFQLVATPAVAFTVDYTGVTPDGSLANDVLVEVKSSDGFSGNVLTASSVEVEDRQFLENGILLEIEGYISAVTSSTDFNVGDIRVDASAALFKNGTPADVAVDVEVEIEGRVEDRLGSLILVADEVEFELEDDVRIEGPVDAVDASANILSIISIGVAYSDTLSITEFEDKDAINIDVDDLASNADTPWVRIEGVLDSGGNVFATRIEQDNGDTDLTSIILEGPAAGTPGPSGGTFTILGVTIDRQPGVQYQIEDVPVSATVFFTNLTDGRFVKARGTFSGSTLTAEELDLDN